MEGRHNGFIFRETFTSTYIWFHHAQDHWARVSQVVASMWPTVYHYCFSFLFFFFSGATYTVHSVTFCSHARDLARTPCSSQVCLQKCHFLCASLLSLPFCTSGILRLISVFFLFIFSHGRSSVSVTPLFVFLSYHVYSQTWAYDDDDCCNNTIA
ncbi:hypothetical protein VTN77DRAFT_1154 [Rasamsonia byssochlamydoides]|uniref:uncharacterized protein n=1 Tax=Rasamsonia byssochlamydoides TaxID=89139 RepID=UPI0037424EDE